MDTLRVLTCSAVSNQLHPSFSRVPHIVTDVSSSASSSSFWTVRLPPFSCVPLRDLSSCEVSSCQLSISFQRAAKEGQLMAQKGRTEDITRKNQRTGQRHLVVKAMAEDVAEESGGASKPSVGFLGLGIMGKAMALNLVKAGFSVTVWNRNADKCQPLLDVGARQGGTPAEVTAACDITFAMLSDPAAAVAVACGPDGAINGLGKGKGYVDVSTVDGATAKIISTAVNATGAEYLEAPVSGSKKPAENGTLIFLAGGDRPLFERVAPALDVMGKSRFYLGEAGTGAAMKLVVNMVMGSMMAAFAEGLALGQKVGLDPQTILEVISQGAIATPMFSMKGPSMLAGRYPPAFPLKHQQKDLRLALALGDDVAQPLPVAAAANEVYKRARTTGLGDNDFSAVLEAIRSQEH